MSNFQFVTKFKPHDDKDIYDVYDEATQLTFSLAQSFKGRATLSVHLGGEMLFLYQDEVDIDGDTFSIFTDENFLDAMKDFADSGDAEILLVAQLTLDGEVFEVMESIKNPWF